MSRNTHLCAIFWAKIFICAIVYAFSISAREVAVLLLLTATGTSKCPDMEYSAFTLLPYQIDVVLVE